MQKKFWTNPSVLALCRDRDPIDAISEMAQDLVFRALEHGWHGPPFDPFALASLLAIDTLPTAEVLDARTLPIGTGRFRIEFNPDRPRRRIRYSIFHEIAHTLFPDCASLIRNRGAHTASREDEWQLETLCNIAAAEFLLPIGSLGDLSKLQPSVEAILDLRERYEASAEAALLRIRRLTNEAAMAFSCHRVRGSDRYIVEYAVPTARSEWKIRPGSLLPARAAAAECTAIGYTAKQVEHWPHLGRVYVECVGVAPIPRDVYPRVIGFVRPLKQQSLEDISITYLRGNAAEPRGTDRKVLVQIVNDAAITWGGGGFAAEVRRRWPDAQKMFTEQVVADKSKLSLGSVITCEIGSNLTLASLVAQHGYGLSPRPRIRYGPLRESLFRVSEMARRLGAPVHMPRIGTGQAGGSWPIVVEIIKETLINFGVTVVVYDFPQGKEKPKAQGGLAFTS